MRGAASSRSFDHLVGAGEQRLWHGETHRLCGLEVKHKLVRGRGLHRQIGGLLALEDAIDIARRASEWVDGVGAVRDQATAGGSDCTLPGATGGSLVKVGTGTLTLAGINSYTGATNVNAGALIVDGSIASSILTSVNSGAALNGSGTVGFTSVNAGGFLVPGPVGTPGAIAVAYVAEVPIPDQKSILE
jgi:autotransporter-associated beta strand protein